MSWPKTKILNCRECGKSPTKVFGLCQQCYSKTPECKYQVLTSALKQHGIDVETYQAMLLDQNGGCAICGNGPGSGRKKRLCVDHNHTTNKLRGLLCDRCNKALGLFGDDQNLMRLAIAYLVLKGG
jgi:hypothetical protein